MNYLLNAVQYVQPFASKYLKLTFEKKSHEIESIKFGPGMKYLLDTAQKVQYFASKYLKQTFQK